MKENINKNLPIFPIGTFAKMLEVHPRTLRIYDEEEILSPSRSEKNRRYYSISDLEKGKLILYMTRNLSFGLTAVKFTFAILKKHKIKPESQLEYVKNIAKTAKI